MCREHMHGDIMRIVSGCVMRADWMRTGHAYIPADGGDAPSCFHLVAELSGSEGCGTPGFES